MRLHRSSTAVVGGLLLGAVLLLGVLPARAHEGEESTKAADLVRQAIALVVNEPDKLPSAREKVADARRSEDRSGVDAALLDRADAALAAGDPHQGRALLEQAIGARPHIGTAAVAPIRQTTEAAPEVTAKSGDGNGTEAMPATPMPMAGGAEAGTDIVTDPLDVRPRLDGGDWALLFGSLAVGLAGVYLGLRFRPRREKVVST